MPRFQSFTTAADSLIDIFQQTLMQGDVQKNSELWLNEEGTSLVHPAARVFYGHAQVIEGLKDMVNDVVQIHSLSKKIHSFAGITLIDTLECWTHKEQAQNAFLHATYVVVQNYPDWRILRAHFSPANTEYISFAECDTFGLKEFH